MPTFTLDRCAHPFLDDLEGRFFAVHVPVPGWGDKLVAAQGYVGDFQKCVISAPLAERLGLQLADGSCLGQIAIESYYEGDLTIHRSKAFELTFSQPSAPHKTGEAYFHLCREELSRVFEAKDYDALRPNGTNLFFLVLFAYGDAENACMKIPLNF